LKSEFFSPDLFFPHNFATSAGISTIIFCAVLSEQGISLICEAIPVQFLLQKVSQAPQQRFQLFCTSLHSD
jgi:hypothetical protein